MILWFGFYAAAYTMLMAESFVLCRMGGWRFAVGLLLAAVAGFTLSRMERMWRLFWSTWDQVEGR